MPKHTPTANGEITSILVPLVKQIISLDSDYADYGSGQGDYWYGNLNGAVLPHRQKLVIYRPSDSTADVEVFTCQDITFENVYDQYGNYLGRRVIIINRSNIASFPINRTYYYSTPTNVVFYGDSSYRLLLFNYYSKTYEKYITVVNLSHFADTVGDLFVLVVGSYLRNVGCTRIWMPDIPGTVLQDTIYSEESAFTVIRCANEYYFVTPFRGICVKGDGTESTTIYNCPNIYSPTIADISIVEALSTLQAQTHFVDIISTPPIEAELLGRGLKSLDLEIEIEPT